MAPPEPIAIIGSACRFPGGSDTPSKLWELLREPRDLLKTVQAGRRFDPKTFYHTDPEHHGTTNVQASYFLDEDPAEFDNGFFNIPPSEAEAIDPQQRMLMETVYDALCAGGQTIEGLRGSSSAIIVGLMGDDWSGVLYKDWETLPQYSATGMGRSIMSNRVSYFFDWHGPSITLDTACSSSLVAVHLATQALRNGESRVAVAAGANLLLSPAMYVAESNLHMLSPTGRSRMWDQDVDGYARGEGIAAVVLKSLSDALQDGDRIECIIRATGINQDGKTPGLTMPSASAQAQLIRETYARAGLDLNKGEDRPQLFHAHGTGTPAGDPQEAEAISRAFFPGGAWTAEKLYVNSIKTVIGHTEGSAGLASLISSSLALQHGIIPPNMHFNKLNARIAPFYEGLEVPTSARRWPDLLPGQPRRASINSFGFGGTNAHAIIEAYETPPFTATHGPLFTPLIISAASEKSLRALLTSYSKYLQGNTEVSLRDLAYTLQNRRSTLAFRAAISVSTVRDAVEQIDILLAKEDAPEFHTKHFAIPPPRILGVFTGQGAQWPRMGAKLIESSPFVSKRLDELDSALASLSRDDRPSWTLREQLLADAVSSRVTEAALSQPLCTAVQILLVDLLQLAGIRLHAVVGHSSGEIGAAYAAGLLPASAAIRVAYYRGLHARLASSPKGVKGAMMAVGTSFEDACEFVGLETFEGRLQVAARNAASSITLSGDEDAVAQAVEIFKDEGKFARQLKVDTAYHSAHMLPCAAPYLSSMAALDGLFSKKASGAERPTWYSSVQEGQVMSVGELNAQYWVDNMTSTVLFAPAVAAAATHSGPFDLVLELGPHPALRGPCSETLAEVLGDHIPYSSLLSRGKEDILELSTNLGFVWSILGAGSICFDQFETAVSGRSDARRLIPDLPKYPFDHSKSFWTMSRVSGAHTVAAPDPPHPLLGRRQIERETSHETQWRNILRLGEISWLKGHKIQGQIVFPAAGFVTMALEAVKALAGTSRVSLVTIENLHIGRAMAFNTEHSSVECLFTLHVVRSGKESIQANFSCCSGDPDIPGSSLGLNAEGSVMAVLAEPEPDRLPFIETEDWNMSSIEVERFYDQFTKLKYEYVAPFRGVRAIKRRNGYATGIIADQSGSDWEDQFLVHPAMLDTALQTSSAAFSCPGDGRMWGLFIPAGIRRITINPYFTAYGIGKQQEHPWECILRGSRGGGSTTDITLFSENRTHTFIQIEELEVIPLTAARPEDDTILFSRFDYKIDRPNGDLAAPAQDGITSEYIDDAMKAERVSYFYLRRLLDTITPEERAKALPHYQHLLAWAARTVEMVRRGKNSLVPASYETDTYDQINAILEKSRHRADVRMLEAVGEHVAEVIRSGSSILEYMTQSGLFDFYDAGLGLDIANRQFARMVAQMAHRYPHMKVFEIGAGTGGSTRHLLPALGSAFSSYTYTDISSAFFEAAEERFQEYANRMIFQTYDMEKSPESQGYVQGSYDLVVASNVLHATGKLEDMMTSVRQLLKPGGYLIALELTTNDTLRVGLPMGTLPGWWVGTESGRPWGPTLTLPQWDSLLRRCGFGGVETSTPLMNKLHASAVFAAQAVDDRINGLRSPLSSMSSLPPTEAPRLIMVGGESLTGHRIAERLETLLAPRFNYIERVISFEDLDEHIILPGSTVLCITELDEPVFKNLTPGKLDSLKALWRAAGTVLWVTRGARAEKPHSFMAVGLGRVVKFEYPNVLLQILDLEVLEDKTPHLLAEELLRLEALRKWEKEAAPGDQILWSIEPEVYIESGSRLIPRLYPCNEANGRANSARRPVTKQINPYETPIVLGGDDTSYELQYPSPLRLPCPPPALGLTKTIRLSHLLLQTIHTGSAGYLMACVGIDEASGEQVLALSHTPDSRATVLADWTVPLARANPAKALVAVAAHLTASNILRLVPRGGTLVVHEPDEFVGSALFRHAAQAAVQVVITTMRKTMAAAGWRYIPAQAPRRLVQRALPAGCFTFIDLSQAPGSTQVGQLIAECIPEKPPCTICTAKHFFGTPGAVRPLSSPSQIVEPFQAAWYAASEALSSKDQLGSPPTVQLKDVSGIPLFETPLTVAEFSSSAVSTHVQAVDCGNIFREDRTYLMVGMSGQVGQSLCRWMVERGARHVVLTSRRPKVHPEFIQSVDALGATVRVLPLDITSKESLLACHDEISMTMPPIAGVAQGAMVLEDSLFDRMSFDALSKVLHPKVVGTQLLDDLFHDTPLDFFIVFSSLTGVVGNSGQSNYIAANMFMTALAAQRKKRGVAGSAIAISSVIGIGYVERSEDFSEDYFAKLGFRNISEQDLQQLFAEGIRVGRPDCPENSEIATGIEPLYADTLLKAQFRDDIKFNHFIMERPGHQNLVGKLSSLPVRVQLAEAKTKVQASDIIKESFMARLKRTLMISQEDTVNEKVSLVEQGIDSLMAVEVRSWFLKELEVDIPVLKILGGASITSLLAEAIDAMPTSIVDMDVLAGGRGKDAKAAGIAPKGPKVAPATPISPTPGTGTSSNEAGSDSYGSLHGSPSQVDTPLQTPMTEPLVYLGPGVPLNDIENQNDEMLPKPTGHIAALDHTKQAPGITDITSAGNEAKVQREIPDLSHLVDKEESAPMSYGQARFWFLNDYLEDKRSFNMTVMFKLAGKMNVPRLENAVRILGQRHEALRTRYFWAGEGEQRVPMQGVLPESPIRLFHKKVETEANAYEELKKMHDHIWDLSSWEAAKIHLITVDDHTHFLLVSGHHISWDGYSFTVLFVDLEAAYTGKPLAPLGPQNQYRAFSQLQRESYEMGAMKKTLQEFRQVITNPDIPAIPPFPFAKSPIRPVLDRFVQFEAKATLQPPLVSKLKQLAKENKATMFHVYLAALQALVLRLLPEVDDFFLGVADANRLDKNFMGSLGFFLNLLPLHFTRVQKTRISNLIKDARDKAYGALQRSHVPWNVILKELGIPRTNTHAPIYQLFVDYRQVFQERSVWGGCKLSDETWLNARNGYDLTLGITDNPTGESWLSIRLTANMYTQAGTDLLMRSYVNLLETFAHRIDLEVGALPAYAPNDIEKALQIGRGPLLTLDWPATTSHRIDQMIERHSSESALVDGAGNRLTYNQMGNRINIIASALVAKGAREGAPVGVFQQPGVDWICSMLAVWKVGGVYIPLDLRNSVSRLVSIVEAVKPEVFLTDSDTTTKTKKIGGGDTTKDIVVSDLPDAPSIQTLIPNKAKPESIAVILFTSGTTGKPKGILMTHANLRAESEGYSRACTIPELAKVVLQQTIYSFDVSLDQIVAALAEGGCLVVVPADKRGDPQSITKMMIEHGVTYTVATPSEYEMWFRYARGNLSRCTAWRAAFGGGEHLHRGLIHEFARLAMELPELRLFNNYGPTEATLAITKGEVKHSDPDLEEHVPAGFILPNYTVAVLDDNLQPLPVGVAGEICAGGPGITNGYLDLPGMTGNMFIDGTALSSTAAQLSRTWYRTGDRGRLREDGALYWLGRISGDTQVKVRGFRIEVQEVEVVLLEAAKGALSHAVVTLRGENEDKFLAAHVVFAPEFPESRRPALLKHLESRLPLPPYMQPAVIVPMAHIPVTGNLKFDRQAIRALPLPDRAVNSTAGLDLEKTMEALWRRVIPHSIRVLTPETNFFDVGGTSILLVKLQSLIKVTLNAGPSLVDLMNFNTLGGMARIVRAYAGTQVIDWEAETAVPEPLRQLGKARMDARPRKRTNLTVILAGATGYLGRHLVRRLVDSQQVAEIVCLVRDEGVASLSLPPPHAKVKFMCADISLPDLGLSTSSFAALAAKADVVVHCAANRSFFDDYEALRPINVSSVKDMARLAFANRAPFHIVTSGAVKVYEGAAPPIDGSDGYVASKWVAETFLRKTACQGLQVSLHRPLPFGGDVTSQSAPHGTAASVAVLNSLLRITRKLGTRPDFGTVSGYLDVVPVEEVTATMVSSITGGDSDEGSVEIIEHHGSLRLNVKDFAEMVRNNEQLRALPTSNPLFWFADVKKAGFEYLITSHHLLMSSKDGKLVARR